MTVEEGAENGEAPQSLVGRQPNWSRALFAATVAVFGPLCLGGWLAAGALQGFGWGTVAAAIASTTPAVVLVRLGYRLGPVPIGLGATLWVGGLVASGSTSLDVTWAVPILAIGPTLLAAYVGRYVSPGDALVLREGGVDVFQWPSVRAVRLDTAMVDRVWCQPAVKSGATAILRLSGTGGHFDLPWPLETAPNALARLHDAGIGKDSGQPATTSGSSPERR